jgi:hypothetical protein
MMRIYGKPTERHVAFGGITDSAIELPAQRAFFWQEVTQQLDQLAVSMDGLDFGELPASRFAECAGNLRPPTAPAPPCPRPARARRAPFTTSRLSTPSGPVPLRIHEAKPASTWLINLNGM